MTGYEQLATVVEDPEPGSTVFVCGQRCAAEIDLGAHRIGRVALSPVDVVTELVFRVGGEEAVSVTRGANHVEKHHRLGAGVSAHSRWFALSEDPGLVIWFEVVNSGAEPYRFDLEGELIGNLNFVSKFRVVPNDRGRVVDGLLVLTDQDHPSLRAVVGSSPRWDRAVISSGEHAPDTVCARLTAHVDVAPGHTGHLAVVVAGSDRPGVADATLTAVLSDPAAAFAATTDVWESRTVAGPVLSTPEPAVDRLFAQAKLWAHKDARTVPLGAPFDTSGSGHDEVVALTASPDYHGVFANDSAQSVWELGALGSGFHPVLEATLDVLFGHGTPESVEIDPVGATGRPWTSPLRIGERPQWVVGAASLILWSGRHTDRYWPQIQRVLEGFGADDADGDWLDDYSSSPFPEQPDPGAYHHEMLYASAFWSQAFDHAAKVAVLVGDLERATEYADAAARIADAIEERFGTEHGYASWLDHDHRQHPHRGHTMVLPLQYGLASPARAARAFATLLQPPLASDDGPLAIEPAYPNEGADHAWGFLRWNLVHALFRYDRADDAADLLVRWAEQEQRLGFSAPEGFPTVTGVTGKGYVWTAARTLRAIIVGLCGIELLPHGFAARPKLPTDWSSLRLDGLPFRGATYDLRVDRHVEPGVWVDGLAVADATVPAPRDRGRHEVLVRVRSG